MAAVTYGVFFGVRGHANKVAQMLEGQLQSASDTCTPAVSRSAAAASGSDSGVRGLWHAFNLKLCGSLYSWTLNGQEREAEARTRKPSKVHWHHCAGHLQCQCEIMRCVLDGLSSP